jgi:membrane protease YdiL (CAAX protease family)
VTNGATTAAPRFGALHALLSFALVFLAQIIAAFGLIVVVVIVKMALGTNVSDPGAVRELTNSLGAPLLLVSAWSSTAMLVILLRAWAWPLVPDRTQLGLGLFAPTERQLFLLMLAGVACAGAYLTFIRFAGIAPSGPGGPLVQMVTGNRSARNAWMIVALVYAPVVEELLFRGLMWTGLRASWGAAPAAITVTLLFFLLHLFETIHFWPAMLAIAMLSIATLLARVRTGSVVASMVLHAAYNGTVVLGVYVAS